jgi:hypothetical protein
MPSWPLRNNRTATNQRLCHRDKFVVIRPRTSASGTNLTAMVDVHHLHPLRLLFPTEIDLAVAGDEHSFGSDRRRDPPRYGGSRGDMATAVLRAVGGGKRWPAAGGNGAAGRRGSGDGVEEKKICESRPTARIFASRGGQLLKKISSKAVWG